MKTDVTVVKRERCVLEIYYVLNGAKELSAPYRKEFSNYPSEAEIAQFLVEHEDADCCWVSPRYRLLKKTEVPFN